MRIVRRLSPIVLAGSLLTATASAQVLEPRAFSPAPTGLNFAVVNYGFSSGNIFFDPALPIAGAQGKVHSATLGYLRTLGLFGMSAKIAAIVPYAWGNWDGFLAGEYASRIANGFADPGVQLSVNFVGAPAFSPREMVSYSEGTVVGASLALRLPLGQYDPDRLINLGGNRWVFEPQLGVSQRLGSWTAEALLSASFFSENNDAYQDSQLSQAPPWGITLSAVYQFRPGLWLGFGGGVGVGARTTVSGVPMDTYQRNDRLGIVFAYPLTGHTSLKALYLHSPSTERGADFDTISLSYQVRWGGGL